MTDYSHYSVLFIDDEPNILKSLERDLRKEPFDCYYVNTASQAFEVLEKKDIAVLISDLKMPDVSGMELIARVKESYPGVVRIILTALTDTDTILSAITEGNIYRYLIKPWNSRGELVPALYQAIDHFIFQRERELRTQELILQNKALVQLNKKLKDAQNAIVELERKNTALAMGITTNHEMNQPLMVISANLEMLQESVALHGLTEKENQIFGNIKAAFSQITNILKKYREAVDVSYEEYLDNEFMLVFKNGETHQDDTKS